MLYKCENQPVLYGVGPFDPERARQRWNIPRRHKRKPTVLFVAYTTGCARPGSDQYTLAWYEPIPRGSTRTHIKKLVLRTKQPKGQHASSARHTARHHLTAGNEMPHEQCVQHSAQFKHQTTQRRCRSLQATGG